MCTWFFELSLVIKNVCSNIEIAFQYWRINKQNQRCHQYKNVQRHSYMRRYKAWVRDVYYCCNISSEHLFIQDCHTLSTQRNKTASVSQWGRRGQSVARKESQTRPQVFLEEQKKTLHQQYESRLPSWITAKVNWNIKYD